ncbi:hypothetical protein [Microbacterium esteraromaticum]|uniref:hypothetical protein n=1 Tax=Microbacterium esteraromaticum TaxID=57043 RepID=UPI001C93D21D|nr:hypothetical protein [Microbacterium esteraromaticum]MBY6061610.1 hypothetical protein [Microbacterium esteraromaticum]
MNWADIRLFAQLCEQLGVQPPAAITRGIELYDDADALRAKPPVQLLSLDRDQLHARIVDLSIRAHDRNGLSSYEGMLPGIRAVHDDLASEVRAEAIPELDRVVTDLQPDFDRLSRPLVIAAQEYGFTSATTSDDVIERADENASTAWRDARKAWEAIKTIVTLRIRISTLFDLSPTRHEAHSALSTQILATDQWNHSISFAAGNNWSMGAGFLIQGSTFAHIDWLALAAGGLRLNTPTEVRAKLDNHTGR